MTHTPSPTVIEQARKMAAKYVRLNFGEAMARRCRAGKSFPDLTDAFIAAIELGERRAAAAVVGWSNTCKPGAYISFSAGPGSAELINDGFCDGDHVVQMALAAIRRGMELAT